MVKKWGVNIGVTCDIMAKNSGKSMENRGFATSVAN